jgi:hypothetical protein
MCWTDLITISTTTTLVSLCVKTNYLFLFQFGVVFFCRWQPWVHIGHGLSRSLERAGRKNAPEILPLFFNIYIIIIIIIIRW